ncbi:predicted protein [Phaeodactylum tricornutum CCAP 1055/1]|uniref:HSF-type DNA-binding domain-containing protein n=1 Tax=Phaeodactylum tricornutum (strain CCAP 1055/1) TaxID=556484 RepID=B7FZ65_PHATC|nr:predicted protein [Phaeodactylum tricornutum CCAP 1055/1]EEC48287.1 predicted protein [Phaeodactylum tricornutum CCAP 1055/1]|eukprot:XP_002180096.1 predicted protein [Phaeodactylum tricornutum CCAP 1055/1]
MSDELSAIATLLGLNAGMANEESESSPSEHRLSTNSFKGVARTPSMDSAIRVSIENLKSREAEAKRKRPPSLSDDLLLQKKKRRTKGDVMAHTYPVLPRVVQVCKLPKTHVDHSYRDFSSVPPEAGYDNPASVEEMTFACKLHAMLMNPECQGIINWLPHGRAFRILVPKKMEQDKILMRYFGHNRYSSFLSQLKNYGLKMITRGKDRNCFYHECMLRGLPHLTKYMPKFRDGRRLLPDPANEPDFYTISTLWPVPEKNPEPPQPVLSSLLPTMDATSSVTVLRTLLQSHGNHPQPQRVADLTTLDSTLLSLGVLHQQREQQSAQRILENSVLNRALLQTGQDTRQLQLAALLHLPPPPFVASMTSQEPTILSLVQGSGLQLNNDTISALIRATLSGLR